MTNQNHEDMLALVKQVAESKIEDSEFTILLQGTLNDGDLDFNAGMYGSVPKLVTATVLLMEKMMAHETRAALAFAAISMEFIKNKGKERKPEESSPENVVDFKEALAKLKAGKSTIH